MCDCKQRVNNDICQAILDTIKLYIVAVDRNGNIIYANSKVKNILQEDNLEENFSSAYYYFKKFQFSYENCDEIDYDNFFLQDTLQNSSTKENLILRCKLDDYNYKKIYISLSCFPLVNDKKNSGAIMLWSNITEEYISRTSIKEEREKLLSVSTELQNKRDLIQVLTNKEKEHLMHLKDVINNISEGIVVADTDFRITLYNRAAYKILNMDPIELINFSKLNEKYYIENIEDKDVTAKQLYYDYLKKYISIKSSILKVYDKLNKNTKYIELTSNPIRNNYGKLIYSIITIKDVTEAKYHQINAEEQARFVRDVVEKADVPIAVIDYPAFKYKLYNRKYDELIKHNTDEYTKDVLYRDMSLVAESNKEYIHSPVGITTLNGDKKYYKVKMVPYKGSNNIRIHIYGTDITEETNNNMELEKITKLKDEFFAITSHELRTPLTIIYSSLQLVNRIYKDEITPNIQKTLTRIEQNCSRLFKLINNILDISKAEAGFMNIEMNTFELVSFTEAVVNSANLFAKSKEIDLIFDTNIEEYLVSLDRNKYERILLNLLSNAVKYTNANKKVFVILDIQDDYFSLCVKDEGIGIPNSKLEYIFDRFAQVDNTLSRRAEGTGLGLALTKKFVELMKGKIEVISKEGEGSEFTVTFKTQKVNGDKANVYSIDGENIDDKISIEFSDIN